MAFSRILSYVIGVVFGGLLQVWVLTISRLATGLPITAGELLGDGGLFFFATSLAVGSALSLCDARPLKVGSADLNITCLLGFTVFATAVSYYVAVLNNGLGQPTPFANHLVPQFVCASAALLYWFFVGIRTNIFTKA